MAESTIIVDANIRSATFNCYISLEQATAYMERRLYATPWNDATPEDRVKALLTATLKLDELFDWEGYRLDAHQPLDWPRYEVYNEDGYWEDSDQIPAQIQRATIELALSLLSENRFLREDPETVGLKKVKAGPVEIEFDNEDRPTFTPDAVDRLVAHYVKSNPNAGYITLERR